MSAHRVLVAHNRYRVVGGEERAVGLHVRALAGAGIPHELLERDSGRVGGAGAARALLRGGEAPEEIGAAVLAHDASVAHFHNMQPLLGPRALRAARGAGARVVLHLHNFRLFCAIGVAFHDGAPCFRCHHGNTLPGLALRCRGSSSEAAVYALALARQLGPVLETVDRFVAPSEFAAAQLAGLGVPRDRLSVLHHYLPAERLAGGSRSRDGEYAIAAGRLAPEKGFDTAVEAAAASGVPLRIAGDGPGAEGLRALVASRAAPVELLGRVSEERLAELLAGAAFAVVPTRGTETFGFAALEAMGAGLPVLATRAGALPEIAGAANCVERSDPAALAAAMRALWEDAGRREALGAESLARARERFSEERFTERLLALYDSLAGPPGHLSKR